MKTLMSLFTILLLIGGPLLAAELPSSKEFRLCVNCHGEDGLSEQDDVPIIAGVPKEIQEDMLYAYRDGARQCGDAPLMCKISARLSDDAIMEYAAYYAAQPFVAAKDTFDGDLAAMGKELHNDKCGICHGHPDDMVLDAGVLFGQKKGYLRYSLNQYAAGQREQRPEMAKVVEGLSAEEIESLINFYASYRN